ncbi:HEAT repeat-containing protein 1 [Thrips palmi]|uniref:HEAT repeat-containing protein 1 n=1 Tax=Thrips palmi TaxID=161013 RepID=A0A6P9A459_THRPL|nr:HEAT repeat-containing protein 1 [Thrips palmi]
MATSLAAQLQKLRAPQTSILHQDKKRASLLFDPKEASNYDRQTIYELGVAGLEELKTLNARFSEFESSLFDVSSLSFERAVQSKEANRKLDKSIRKFFYLLSPYFLLKPAHKSLEWLVQRFHVHEYNIDDLLMLALPYHESRIFIRVVQLVDVSSETSRWHWLLSMQKKGIPLSKRTLLNHISTATHFLRLLCDTTVGAVKEHGAYAGVLSTLFGFYSTTILGMFERGRRGATELQMATIIDALQRGLGSPVLDFAAASYIILGRLVATTSLATDVLERLVDRITKANHIELQLEKAMLLVLIYQSQKQNVTNIPFQSLTRLASDKGTAATFGQLISKGYDVVPFLVPLMRDAIEVIKTQIVGCTANLKILVENVLNEVHFTESGAESVVRMFIESYDVSALEEATVPLVATSKINSAEEVTQWYAKMLNQLERSYPTVFDKAVGRALKGLGVAPSAAANLKRMLGFELQLDLFDKLHHHKSEVRAEALMCLSKQYTSLKEKDEQTLKDSLFDLLGDDNPSVVLASLSFPAKVLQRILSPSTLNSRLVRILQNRIPKENSDSKWVQVIQRVISTLTEADIEDPIQETESLIALMPHMLLNGNCLKWVLKSSFGSRNSFLKMLKSGGKQATEGALLQMISNASGVSPIQSVLNYGEKFLKERSNPKELLEQQFCLLLLLGASLPQGLSTEQSLQALQLAVRLMEGHEVAVGVGNLLSIHSLSHCLSRCAEGYLPVEGYLHVVKKIIVLTKLNISFDNGLWLDMEGQSPAVMLLVQIYCVLSEGCASENSEVQSAYVSTLQLFFKTHFNSNQKQVEFLANFWSSHRVVNCSTTNRKGPSLEIQVRSLRLGAILLSKSKNTQWVGNLNSGNIVLPSLLISLCCPTHSVRKAAIKLVRVLGNCVAGQESYGFLIQQIIGSIPEITLDSEQLQLVLYTSLSPDPIVQKMLPKGVSSKTASEVLNGLLEIVLSKTTPPYISAGLLHVLTSVNSEDILRKLLPLLDEILTKCKGLPSLTTHFSTILCNVSGRLDASTAHLFKSDSLWTVITELLANWRTVVLIGEDRRSCPAEIACSQVTRELWDALPKPQAPIQQKLLTLLISAGTESENPLVLSAVGKCVKQLSIDASIVVAELNKMKEATVAPTNATQKRRRSVVAPPSPQILEMKEWRCGITLLELLQNKKKLANVQLLLPVLFDLLHKCLYFEEQAPVEYTKQLLLSCILHCCQKLSPDGKPISTDIVPTQVLDVEAVVHCVRGTQNPQTHHHALLLLAHMAALVPEQVLLNIMAIFTFMGSLVLRQDDAYSFQIITKIVDTIIPILIKASNSGSLSNSAALHLDTTIASVMRVFVDALLDIPEHRRLSLFHRLLTTLDPQQYLWLFLCLVMESHAVHHSESANDNNKKTRGAVEAPKRIEVALQIVTQFTPVTILSNCVRLLQYMLCLPVEPGAEHRKPLYKKSPAVENLEKFKVKSLFDVNNHTPKQLRHYKYTIVTFLSALLSSLPFVNQITSLDDEGTDGLVSVYMEFLEVLLALIQVFSRQSELSNGSPSFKYWRVMLAQAYDILDKVNALLPSKLFLNIVGGLMTNEMPSLRRKAMELLNSRLSSSQREAFISSCDSQEILALLNPLVNVVSSIDALQTSELNEEVFLNQQTALLSIKYLAKYLAYENYSRFKPLLEHMTSLIHKGQMKNSNLLASVVLCAAELCSSLRAHAISSLPLLMPAFIKLLASEITEVPEVVQVSLAASMFRIVESLAPFISPYLHPLLVELCALSASHFKDDEEQGRVAQISVRLKSTRQKIASSIPTRVLVPAVEGAYKDLVSRKQLDGIAPLMTVLAESFAGLVSADLVALQSTLTDFFLSALQFRSVCGPDVSSDQVEDVESNVIKALVAFVLKLSETSFRPLYMKFFDWATRLKEDKERTITFYKLSFGFAQCLKGLYVSFAAHFLKNAAVLLDHCNVSKIGEKEDEDMVSQEAKGSRYEELYFGSGPMAEEKSSLLVTAILKTLHCVFLYDSQNFLSNERFETLMQPIVDQLENTLGGEAGLRQRATEIVVPCVTQMALACSDDTLWKQLNYQILIKTRNSNPMVRLVSLEAVCGVARKLGEGFLPLLPETVPFLAELLEDEEESIETACRRAVQDLEQVLGEPIQKYF